MNDPAATPRNNTTDGSPRAARYVPRGNNPSTAGTSSATPADSGEKGEPPHILSGVLEEPGADRDPEGKPNATPVEGGGRLIGIAHVPGRPPPYLRKGKRERKHHKHGNPEEHPPPPEMLGHRTGRERPDNGRHHPTRGERGHDGGPQPLRIGPPDDDVQSDDDQPTPQPLHGPPENEHPHDLSGPRHHQPGSESPDPTGQRPERPPPIRPLPGEHHPEETGREVPGERERVQRHPAQLPSGNRHRRPNRRRLKGDQQNNGHDPDTERPMRPPQHGVTTLVGQVRGGVRDTGVTRFKDGHAGQRKVHRPR